MRIHKRIMSIVIACVLFFTGLPAQFMNFDGIPYAYAEGGTSAVDIRYDDFSDTEGLQLNGVTLIEDNAIRLECGEGARESVFTMDKVTLGENLSFSTAFSFRNISPSTPAVGTKGGFTFTLQPVGNSVVASDFHDESISPSLSVAFTADYMETGGGTARITEYAGNLNLAAMSDFTIAEVPITRCEISAVPYTNGAYNTAVSKWLVDTYYAKDESSDFYHVWMGYDGGEQLLHMLCLAPSGGYTYFNTYIDLFDTLLTNEVYAGFMGSMGDSGGISEISSWYFKNDLSIFNEAIADADEIWLSDIMESNEANPIDYSLPNYGHFGSAISWESSDTDVIAEDGMVTLPTLEEGPQTLTLTATILKGSAVRITRTFNVTVKVPDEVIATADFDWLTESVILNENDSLENVISDLLFPASGLYGSTISWSSSNAVAADWDGTVIRPDYYAGDAEVTLTAYINMNSITLRKTFDITVKALGMADEDIMNADYLWLNIAQLLNGNFGLDSVTGDITLPTVGQYGSTISWESSDETVVDIDGKVARPAYADGDKTVILTATIGNSSTITKTFTVIVKALEQADEKKLKADEEWLTHIEILNGNTSQDNVVGNLSFPLVGPMGSIISWASGDETVVDIAGRVTRPAYIHGDKIVTLTATLSKGSLTATKEFIVKVIKLEQTDAEKLAADNAWLSDEIILNGNTALDDVTEDLNLPTSGPSGSAISWESSNEAVVDIAGNITRPACTVGDVSVTLTATLTKGSIITKTFTVIIKALGKTESEAVNFDLSWLITYITEVNGALDAVYGDLFLPTEGPSGTVISWTSDTSEVLEGTGKVTRPTYTSGDKAVTLTATIRKGSSATAEKMFTVTVKKLEQTAQEKVDADAAWLTDAQILNRNSALDNITNHLTLPVLGEHGSNIAWSSSDTSVVAVDGTVFRPSYIKGSKNVTLTATITMGTGAYETKTFVLTVKPLDITDAEAAYLDYEWLWRYNILGENFSKNAVTKKLSFPVTGPNHSTITWESNMPSVISNDGTVNRPELGEGHKTVKITATVSKGNKQYRPPFYYVVLEKTDTIAPAVVSTSPENNSTGVSWDTKALTVTFSETIVEGPASNHPQTFGIELQGAGSTRIDVKIQENKLLITPYTELSSGVNRLIIPAGAVADTAGNPSETYEMTFIVESRPVRKIAVIFTTPQNIEKDVDTNIKEIYIRFDTTDLVFGEEYYRMMLRDKSGLMRSTVGSLKGDTVILNVSTPLDPGAVYEIVIPAGVVRDRFNNKNEEKLIQFRTKYAAGNLMVISTNPYNGQAGVNVNQAEIYVTFSQEIKPYFHQMRLTDDKGNTYALSGSTTSNKNTLKLRPYTLRQLGPNTVYTLSGPYSTPDNPNQLEFSTQFTSSSNELVLRSTFPTAWAANVPLDNAVELSFNAPVRRGLNYVDITFTDSDGNAVAFTGEEIDSGIRLTPVSKLSPATSYTVRIPEGAYQGDGDIVNDAYQLTFTTVKQLNLSLNNLKIPDSGFVGKLLLFDAAEAENIARRDGYKITSYQWRINGEVAGTQKHLYHTFTNPGNHEMELSIQDNKGNTYIIEQTIDIQLLTNIRMSLSNQDGTLSTVLVQKDGTVFGLNQYELKLMQDGQFIYGEEISVTLFKDGIQQRTYNKLRTQYGDDVYCFTFTPQYGDYGMFELEFTYNGNLVKQTIRVPVNILSAEPLYAKEFTFRLYDVVDQPAGFYEGADTLEVTLNGKKMRAYKKWYADKNCYAYAIPNENILANTYYDFQVSLWRSNQLCKTVYVGKDGSDPVIMYGNPIKPGGVQVSINYAESSIKEPFTELYFEGVSAKLILNVEADWNGYGTGYYEIKTTNDRFNLKVNYDGSKVQKITLDPGRQLKEGEQLCVRMVAKDGIASGWQYCPYINVIPQPSIMGKKLSISVQGGEYAVNWPTVFDGVMGGSIGFLDGVPVIGGGNFGIGGDMPTFEGEVTGNYYYPEMDLSFGVSGSYSTKNKKTYDTKYKKLKKVSIVGYEFEMSVEGAFTLNYDSRSREWSMNYFYILIVGEGTKTWSQGYKILGVGFEAGVGLGAQVTGLLKIENQNNEKEYSGFVGLQPHAFLFVDGDFAVAAVSGYLNAKLPAEIHFPTGYIGVGISVKAEINARALTWGKTLYEKELVKVHWDNGRPKVTLMSMQELAKEFSDKENAGLELLPREYSNRPSVWLAEEDTTLLAKDSLASSRSARLLEADEATPEQNPNIRILMENIYPEAEQQLVKSGNEMWLVWSDDNPERDAVNRTQLRYSVQKDGLWQEPVWIEDDETADFSPAVAAVEDGVLMAWHNIGKAITEEEGLDEMLKNSEISVTESIYSADGSSPKIIMLTNDDAIDHSPTLASNGKKALLIWTKSEELGLSLDSEENSESKKGSQLFYSAWSDGTWSTPSPIGSNNATVLDTSLSMEGEQGLLLYTLDIDNNLYTYEDREVFARVYDGNAWGEAIQLSSNNAMDSAPKVVSVNNQWFITWLQDGKVQYKVGLSGETETAELLQTIQGDYQLVAKSGSRPLISLVYSQPGEEKAKGISALFYDVVNGQWGDAISLVAPQEYAGAMSAVFTDDGNLNVTYSEAKIITEAVPMVIDDEEELVETTTISNKVDLKLLSYAPIHDVALLEEDGVFLSTEFPLPGTVTTVYVTLRNEGDFAENTVVYLYDGNPDADGKLIGETSPQLISARSSRELEITWLVSPEEKDSYHLYAIARSVDGVQDIDTNNNTIDLEFSNADIDITALNCENIAADDYLVMVTVANRGSKTLEGVKVRLENAENAHLLETKSIEHMEPGQKTVLTYIVPSAGLEKDEDGQINLLARVVPPQGIQEEFTDNNTRSFSLKPSAFEMETINPGQGDKQVDPASVLKLTFNMNIGKGAGYDRIKLMDEALNEIAVHKSIEGSTLTITPTDTLEYGTIYTLSLPVDALGDAYGHSLTKDIICSFMAKTTNPEIVSAYPGEFMENAALNTEIRLKYNQRVQKGPRLSGISLYGSDNERISASAIINGESLILNYSGKLNESTTYTVQVPRGAVQNDRGESQQEDYLLTFTTVDVDDGGDDGDDGASGDNGNGGNSGSQPSSGNQQYVASINIDGTEKTIDIRTEDRKAVLELRDLASEIFAGNQQTVVNIPPIPDVNCYTLRMPAEVLSSSGASSMTVNTPWGSVTIPSGMLSNMEEINGKTAGISIAAGDASILSEAIKAAIGDRPILQLTLMLDGVEADWNNPFASVRVSIPYAPTAAEEESPESIVVWYIDAQGNIMAIPNGYYKQSTEVVSFSTTHFSDFAVAFNSVHFKDVSDDAWYNSAVSYIAAREITTGTGNGNFSPDNSLTRAQAITLIMRAYGIAPDTNPTDNFSDAGNTWYTGYLAAAKRLSISKGVGNKLFAPDKEITRQEMFTLLYNALGAIKQLPGTNNSDEVGRSKSLSDFTDEGQITSWAREAMTLLVETGIVNGNAGKLMPLNTTTRAEMAQVLYNLMTR